MTPREPPKIYKKALNIETHKIGSDERKVARPITFTPFASKEPCTARCQFCSEALIYKHATQLSASLRPGLDYFKQLSQAFSFVGNIAKGLSLSGLEASSNEDWLLGVLDVATDAEHRFGRFEDRVIYSNATGFSRKRALELLKALQKFDLTRAEISRHSPVEIRNQAIMRFRDGIAVKENAVFESSVRLAMDYIPVKMVCVIQEGGVADEADLNQYLAWVQNLGVREVVFRELSKIHDLYKTNSTSKYVERTRVPIERILAHALQNESAFEYLERVDGYYYQNHRFLWKNEIEVVFETSDYEIMKRLHASDTIYKFVFHANGNLTADWDPGHQILLAGNAS